jgi:hypothetical protein
MACTLVPSDARSQLGEWEELLRRVVGGSERVSANRLELTLAPDADIASIIDLAQREATCCAFFSFALAIQTDHLVLVVEVPDDAVGILDQFGSSNIV